MSTSNEVREQIMEKARFYANECSTIFAQGDPEPDRGSAAVLRNKHARQVRQTAASMMNAQALGLLMAVQIMDDAAATEHRA